MTLVLADVQSPNWEEIMPERRSDVLYQAMEQMDEKHDAAHKRLREDFRELEERMNDALQLIRDRQQENRERISKIADMPPNAEKLILNAKTIIAMVIFAVSITGGVWSANSGVRAETSGLRSDVRDILTRMEAQKNAYDSIAKLQEVQSNTVKTAIDDMKRRQELQQYEIQNLKEVILTGKGKAK